MVVGGVEKGNKHRGMALDCLKGVSCVLPVVVVVVVRIMSLGERCSMNGLSLRRIALLCLSQKRIFI
jgi:hypothetical protein